MECLPTIHVQKYNRKLTGIESLLLGQQRLNRGEVTSEIFRAYVILLVSNPRLDDVGLPHEL